MISKILNYFKKPKGQLLQLSSSEMQEKLDEGIIMYDTEIVGYANREIQWKTYETIASLIPLEKSILDFGCGRGDFIGWYNSDKNTIKYTGIDFNQTLIDAGNKLYDIPGSQLICSDWNKTKVKADWCININSNNYLYKIPGFKIVSKKFQTPEYSFSNAKRTIEKMYDCANEGVVITMASELVNDDNSWIKFNPGDVLNWARKKYTNVVIDHTIFQNSFILVIYKNNQNG